MHRAVALAAHQTRARHVVILSIGITRLAGRTRHIYGSISAALHKETISPIRGSHVMEEIAVAQFKLLEADSEIVAFL